MSIKGFEGMQYSHSTDGQEPLEAGEDGTFDLGDPSPPSSPITTKAQQVKPQEHSAPQVTSQRVTGPEAVPPALPASPEIEDDWEEVDARESAGREPQSADGALEVFEDAVEAVRRQTESTVADTSIQSDRGIRSSSSHRGSKPLANDGHSFIAEGLANVRLPMGIGRSCCSGGERGGDEDSSDGEGEFHDAFDSAEGLLKDAAKATQMKETGNAHYKNGSFEDAVDYYTMALQYCPTEDKHKKDRAVYLGNRAAAHLRLEQYDETVTDCNLALELDPAYVKALLRRAQANELLEKYDLALEDSKAVAEIDPNLRSTKENVARLEKLQSEKNEKIKEEAIGKLKELGNSVLGNFGLSLDNFKMVQDPNSGSYSINFER